MEQHANLKSLHLSAEAVAVITTVLTGGCKLPAGETPVQGMYYEVQILHDTFTPRMTMVQFFMTSLNGPLEPQGNCNST